MSLPSWRTTCSTSNSAVVVICPPTKTRPIVTKVLQATRELGIRFEIFVQHCILNLIAKFVRMSFGDGL